MEQSEPRFEIPTFLDDTSRRWEVREIHEPLLPDRSVLLYRPEFAAGWLLFTSDGERRRLAPPPSGWREAPEEQLRQWCAAAAPARTPS
jgi:hypothetical protein